MPPTAVWIVRKDRHLLAGEATEFECAAVGASPAVRYIHHIAKVALVLRKETMFYFLLLFQVQVDAGRPEVGERCLYFVLLHGGPGQGK